MATRTTHRIYSSQQSSAVSKEMVIQRVRMSDLRKVAQVQKEAFGPKLAYGLPTLLILSITPSVRFLVARQGNQIVGCAIGDRLGSLSRVVNICVAPEKRRQGIASALLKELEKELPVGNMTLMVQAENSGARALYEQQGYRESGLNRDYYGVGRDGYWMTKNRPGPLSKEVGTS